MSEQTVILFRPVGEVEMKLIEASGMTAFPPRLPEQPIFYPVTNQQYAEKIARDWNTKDERSGYVGYVLRFAVNADYLKQFPVKQVGDREHTEYWIPAERLEEFNRNIVGKVEVLQIFRRD